MRYLVHGNRVDAEALHAAIAPHLPATDAAPVYVRLHKLGSVVSTRAYTSRLGSGQDVVGWFSRDVEPEALADAVQQSMRDLGSRAA